MSGFKAVCEPINDKEGIHLGYKILKTQTSLYNPSGSAGALQSIESNYNANHSQFCGETNFEIVTPDVKRQRTMMVSQQAGMKSAQLTTKTQRVSPQEIGLSSTNFELQASMHYLRETPMQMQSSRNLQNHWTQYPASSSEGQIVQTPSLIKHWSSSSLEERDVPEESLSSLVLDRKSSTQNFYLRDDRTPSPVLPNQSEPNQETPNANQHLVQNASYKPSPQRSPNSQLRRKQNSKTSKKSALKRETQLSQAKSQTSACIKAQSPPDEACAQISKSTERSSTKSTEASPSTTIYFDKAWSARLEELKSYKAKFGNCLVPKKSRTHPELGIWVMNQRAQYKVFQEDRLSAGASGNKSSTMTHERIRALEDIGFVWSMCDHVDWDDRLEELRAYKLKHGDCLVPNKYPPNPQLGTWVNKQRTQYKLMLDGKVTSMTKERVAALNEIGFVWSKRDLVDWSQRLEELKQYKAIHGDCLVPNKYAPNPQLGIWAMHQRAQYRKMREGKPSPMTEERVVALEEVGFVWAISHGDSDWTKRISDLKDYRTKHGNCLVPNKYPENPGLGAWVGKQRKQYKLLQEGKPCTLTQERINELEDLGFAWSLRSLVDWNARWLELKYFKEIQGNCMVPQHYPSNPQLGTWVSNQRKQYRLMQENKPSPMTPYRVKKLESLGFLWSKSLQETHGDEEIEDSSGKDTKSVAPLQQDFLVSQPSDHGPNETANPLSERNIRNILKRSVLSTNTTSMQNAHAFIESNFLRPQKRIKNESRFETLIWVMERELSSQE